MTRDYQEEAKEIAARFIGFRNDDPMFLKAVASRLAADGERIAELQDRHDKLWNMDSKIIGDQRAELTAKDLRIKELEAEAQIVRVIFDGPPGPESGRFVECEDENGASIRIGQWAEIDEGFWELRIPFRDARDIQIAALKAERDKYEHDAVHHRVKAWDLQDECDALRARLAEAETELIKAKAMRKKAECFLALEEYGCTCASDPDNPCPHRFIYWTDEDWVAAEGKEKKSE